MSASLFRAAYKFPNASVVVKNWNKVPLVSSLKNSHASLCFSSTQASEVKSDVLEKLSIKDGNNQRLTSEKFLNEVKQLVGKDIPDEEFTPPRKAFDVIAAEYDTLLHEASDFRDKYQRSLAETENVRRRGQKQVEEAKIYAVQGFCKDLLEVADNLERAVDALDINSLEKTAELKGLHEGISMTKLVLHKVFEKHGLKKVDPEGEKFDPNLHEALMEIPKENSKYEPGVVGVVMKTGYSLHGRPIRPAQVGVVKG